MNEFLTLAVVGVGTYLLRSAFLVAGDGRPPAALEHLLPHVAPAVLAAIVAPALLAPNGAISAGETLPALAAAGVTWLLWSRTQRMPLALLGGLGLWWILGAVLP